MSAFKNARPDSPKGQVYEAFKSKGADAARKLGAKLEIASHRVERWLKGNGAGFQAQNEKNKAAAEKPKAKKVKAKKVVSKKPVAKKKPVAPKPAAPKAEAQPQAQA